jgi:hypothetical protein
LKILPITRRTPATALPVVKVWRPPKSKVVGGGS